MSSLPLHPFLIHFPIALFLTESGLLWAGALRRDRTHDRLAAYLFRIGSGFMGAAFITGWMDAGSLKEMSDAMRRHFYAAVALLVFYTARLLCSRLFKNFYSSQSKANLLSALIGALLVLATAFLGGKLVYS